MIFSLQLSSQNKNTRVLVFLRIFTLPIISSPIFDAPINFRSKDIVTHGALSTDLCAAVPAPASTNADKYPPWVMPAAFKWFSFIVDLNSYSFAEMFLKMSMNLNQP